MQPIFRIKEFIRRKGSEKGNTFEQFVIEFYLIKEHLFARQSAEEE